MSEPNEHRLDVEALVPQTTFVRVMDFAQQWRCSIHHILNLIKSGDIVVPQALQNSAPSRSAMRIPRASLIAFLRERSSLNITRGRRREKEEHCRGASSSESAAEDTRGTSSDPPEGKK